MVLLVSGGPDPVQIAAWEAAIFGAIFGAIVGIINLGLGLLRQSREDRRKRAEFGYKILDDIFKDEWASELLYELDATAPTGERRKSNILLALDFAAYFKDGERLPADRLQVVCSRLDSLLYFLDRLEHAIAADLTSFETVQMPIGYYVRILARFKPRLTEYISGIGYERALRFLDRFTVWKSANQASG